MSDNIATSPEQRLILETGLEAQVAAIIEPVMHSMGYQLVRIRTNGENGFTLQIMAERFDGTMTVEDCEAISRAISPVLEVEDPIDRAYHLELSSPGIDRPMVRKGDFKRWSGHLVKCETTVLIENRKRFRGWIEDVTEEAFVIDRDDPAADEVKEVTIPFSALAEGKLILTDELIDAALKADKQAKKEQAAANQNKSADSADEE
ncbi:MAG: ribosome maturation factor RimP [Lentilitoribacter sp.]